MRHKKIKNWPFSSNRHRKALFLIFYWRKKLKFLNKLCRLTQLNLNMMMDGVIRQMTISIKFPFFAHKLSERVSSNNNKIHAKWTCCRKKESINMRLINYRDVFIAKCMLLARLSFIDCNGYAIFPLLPVRCWWSCKWLRIGSQIHHSFFICTCSSSSKNIKNSLSFWKKERTSWWPKRLLFNNTARVTCIAWKLR